MWITDGLYLTYEQALNNANIEINFMQPILEVLNKYLNNGDKGKEDKNEIYY